MANESPRKVERDVTSQGVDLPLDRSYWIKSAKQQLRGRMAEIEKVKKRREERAIEKARFEKGRALLARSERARKAEEFDFNQSNLTSEQVLNPCNSDQLKVEPTSIPEEETDEAGVDGGSIVE
ncbi:hypothetical protein Vadar_027071 [Vaccinium darrowii]|uniref:Uncharacterized protein n=1 Tax=Vaccinium darrowii TaxID=229202 RepID=A0ACB7Z0G6_9ERIC|nr:hypothetical protein Vadar_027071 [Vaccinium darrowii]